jgi:hypothetical protein
MLQHNEEGDGVAVVAFFLFFFATLHCNTAAGQ